uniref:Putative secreted protein n=1 Tax=Anopheles marajoara TaxID=58244 RepID=A0A2M4CE49_9DIPT
MIITKVKCICFSVLSGAFVKLLPNLCAADDEQDCMFYLCLLTMTLRLRIRSTMMMNVFSLLETLALSAVIH